MYQMVKYSEFEDLQDMVINLKREFEKIKDRDDKVDDVIKKELN